MSPFLNIINKYLIFTRLVAHANNSLSISLTVSEQQWSTKCRPLYTSVQYLLFRWRMPLLLNNVPPNVDHYINRFDIFCSLGNKQVINKLVKFIQETLPFIATDKQTSFVMKYEDLTVLYNLLSLVIPRKCYTLPNITFSTIFKIINL